MKVKKVKKIVLKILALFFVMYLIINIINIIVDSSLTVSIAERGVLEDSVSLDGYIFRTQELIYSSVGGVLETLIPDGERVSVGTRVATVYMGNVPTEVLDELRQINDRMALLRSANLVRTDIFARDPIAIERQIAEGTSAVIEAAYLRDGERLARARRNLDELIMKRNFAMGNIFEESETIEQLDALRREIETRHGIRRADLEAPAAGVFVSNVDGLEEYLRIDDIPGLTPSDIDALDKISIVHNNEVVPERAAAKIVDNHRWYFVAAIDTWRLHPLQEGDVVWLRFFDVTDTRVEGRITYISQDEDGRSVIAVYARGYADSIYGISRVSIDLIRSTYRGLRIETAAIRVSEDGRTGVYVIRNDRARFREVEVLYNTPDWHIIYEDIGYRTRDNAVRVFDEVIVSSRDRLTDGMVVRR